MDCFVSIDLYNKVIMKKITLIWTILVMLTSFAFLLGYFEILNNFFIFLLLVTTFLKGQLIIDYFMNLREIQLKYRILPTIWIVVVLVLVSIAYYLPVT